MENFDHLLHRHFNLKAMTEVTLPKAEGSTDKLGFGQNKRAITSVDRAMKMVTREFSYTYASWDTIVFGDP